MNKKFLILASWVALVSPGIASAQNETGVCLGQMVVTSSHETEIPPIREIVILSDSTKNGVLIPSPRWPNGKSGNALYSICDSNGDFVRPLTPVHRDGVVHIEEMSQQRAGVYHLKIVAGEDCTLFLNTDTYDGIPCMEEIPLESAVTYRLDLIVNEEDFTIE